MAEWLRRWIANPMGSALMGSNPFLVTSFYLTALQIVSCVVFFDVCKSIEITALKQYFLYCSWGVCDKYIMIVYQNSPRTPYTLESVYKGAI